MWRQRHFKAVLHVMDYQKLQHNSKQAFDPSNPNINHSNSWEFDWTDFCEGAEEAIPSNAPPLR